MQTQSWAWMGSGTWPGFSSSNANNLNANGNGRAVDPAGYRTMTWSDGNGDGAIYDNDANDGTTAGTDRVIINGQTKIVHEVAQYTNSTLVIGGQSFSVRMVVWVFTDGTYMVRLPDSHIPANMHHDDVQTLRLGTWDGAEYAGNYTSSFDNAFVCFAAETRIATPAGDRPVGLIGPGDLVLTADHGAQPVIWAGRRRVPGLDACAPVLIAAGALGTTRDLRVSPQHRMLVTGWRAEVLFGLDEVLVPAVALVNGRTIRRAPCAAVTYVHLLLPGHEVLFAEGAPAESLFPGDIALGAVGAAARDELRALFPDLAAGHAGVPPARPILRRREAMLLA
jgi:hypothetical protein